MMMPPDPLRQKMLFRTELKTVGALGFDATELAASMNAAIDTLARDGYTVSQILQVGQDPLAKAGYGMVIIGQRMVSPVTDPTPQGAPVPGTNAVQTIEVIYSYARGGQIETEQMPTLVAAVQRAAADLEASARTQDAAQPISIHVTSVTAYGPGDIAVLKERFR